MYIVKTSVFHNNFNYSKTMHNCFKTDLYGYHGNKSIPFLKITVAYPKLIAPCKRLLEQGISVPPYPPQGFQSYESNIDFEIR